MLVDFEFDGLVHLVDLFLVLLNLELELQDLVLLFLRDYFEFVDFL